MIGLTHNYCVDATSCVLTSNLGGYTQLSCVYFAFGSRPLGHKLTQTRRESQAGSGSDVSAK
jgi:hypothetical protein